MKTQKPVALVTGASSGMGKDFALRLIGEGYTVYGAARRAERMSDIEAAGGKVIGLDVTDDSSLINCVQQIIREVGRIDVLINNAGYGQFGALEDVPIDEGRRQMETNLLGPARLRPDRQGSQSEATCRPLLRRQACRTASLFA